MYVTYHMLEINYLTFPSFQNGLEKRTSMSSRDFPLVSGRVKVKKTMATRLQPA